MSRSKIDRLGMLPEFDPRDLTRDQGHEYGRGRATKRQDDKRNRRKLTRKDKVRESMRGW